MAQQVLTMHGRIFFNNLKELASVEKLQGFYLNGEGVSWYKDEEVNGVLIIDSMITTRFDSNYIIDIIANELFSKGASALVMGVEESSMSVGDNWYMGRQTNVNNQWKNKYINLGEQDILEQMILEANVFEIRNLQILLNNIDDYFNKK